MVLIFLKLLVDLDAPKQLQNLGIPVPGAAHIASSSSRITFGDIHPSHLPKTSSIINSSKCVNNPPCWMCLSLTNLSADPGSEGDMPGPSAPFPEDSVTVFFPVDTGTMNEGTGDESVVQAPTIHAIIDTSLNAMLLADVPGKFHSNYLTT